MAGPRALPSEGETLRVAYVLPDPGIPVGGTKGASVHVDALCGAMAQLGVDVTLYAMKVVGPLSAKGSNSVRVVHVQAPDALTGLGADATRLRAIRHFFQVVGAALDERRPDWVHERFSLFAGEGTAMAAERDLPRVLEVNAPVADERIAHFSLDLVSEARQEESDAVRGASVMAVSHPLAQWALERGARSATVVANGADTAGLSLRDRAAARSRIRRHFGFRDDEMVIGFAGSLKPWHGVELLVEAVQAYRGANRIGLLIVGDGPQRASIEERIASTSSAVNVALTGAVPANDVPEFLAAMDLAVAPYLASENFYFSPLKVVEAMAAGIPVVASDFGPVRDLLGSTGVLVGPGNIDELVEVIAQLAADPQRRALMAEAGRARALDHFDWSVVAQRAITLGTASTRPIGVR